MKTVGRFNSPNKPLQPAHQGGVRAFRGDRPETRGLGRWHFGRQAGQDSSGCML